MCPVSVASKPAKPQLPPIPESIRLTKVQIMLRMLGLQLEGLRGFTLHSHSIEAEYYARNEDGHIIADTVTGEPQMHHVSIPVVRD